MRTHISHFENIEMKVSNHYDGSKKKRSEHLLSYSTFLYVVSSLYISNCCNCLSQQCNCGFFKKTTCLPGALGSTKKREVFNLAEEVVRQVRKQHLSSRGSSALCYLLY